MMQCTTVFYSSATFLVSLFHTVRPRLCHAMSYPALPRYRTLYSRKGRARSASRSASRSRSHSRSRSGDDDGGKGQYSVENSE